MVKEAILYERIGSSVKCTACSHYCLIQEGKTGICGVRRNVGGKLHLLVYGRPVAVHVDPVEKKPLFHFLPGSEIFSLGTVGCNFACDFCQNWDISQSAKDGKEIPGHDMPPEKIIDYCTENKIPSIAFTYNEPAIFFEYAYDTMKLAKKNGIKTVFVSNGYMSQEAIAKMKGLLDAINIDLKSFNPDFYKRICKAKLDIVLENIRRIHAADIWLEITTLVVPGENDSSEELKQAAEFISSIDKNIPWHVTAFHPDYKMKDKNSTPKEKLHEAYEIGKKAGLKFVYTGNILNVETQNTYCQGCGKMIIEREWHEVKITGLKDGKCASCGMGIGGVWK